MNVIIAGIILTITGIVCIILWHKKIDSDTTWIYGIYVALVIISLIFALIIIQQC